MLRGLINKSPYTNNSDAIRPPHFDGAMRTQSLSIFGLQRRLFLPGGIVDVEDFHSVRVGPVAAKASNEEELGGGDRRQGVISQSVRKAEVGDFRPHESF